MAASTFQVGQQVYYIQDNIPQTDTVKIVDSEVTGSQVNTYRLSNTINTVRKESELYSSKGNLITAFTNLTNALS